MSEGILKPEASMRSVAIAEATILESIRNSLSNIADLIREIYEALNDLSKGMFESVKVRSERVWEAKRKTLEELRNYVTHFVRVRLGLDNRDLYQEVFRFLREAIYGVSDASCLLRELAASGALGASVEPLLNASKSIIESVQGMIDATMILLDNPRSSIDALEKSFRSLEAVEASYRESSYLSTSHSLRELMRILVSIARSLSSISENLRWVALQRL